MGDIDINKIKVFGAYLDRSSGRNPMTGKKCPILIKSEDANITKNKLRESLTCTVDGPTKPEVIWSTVADQEPDFDERTLVAYFVPIKPGKHKLTIRCNGKKLPSTPFEYEVSGEAIDLSKLLEKVL